MIGIYLKKPVNKLIYRTGTYNYDTSGLLYCDVLLALPTIN